MALSDQLFKKRISALPKKRRGKYTHNKPYEEPGYTREPDIKSKDLFSHNTEYKLDTNRTQIGHKLGHKLPCS